MTWSNQGKLLMYNTSSLGRGSKNLSLIIVQHSPALHSDTRPLDRHWTASVSRSRNRDKRISRALGKRACRWHRNSWAIRSVIRLTKPCETGCPILLRPILGSRVDLGNPKHRRAVPMTPQPSDWRYLAEQASKETDPAKMLRLVEELNRVLEHEQASRLNRYHTFEGR